jgi:Acyl-CoA dehydrogenase, N-terminal domain.
MVQDSVARLVDEKVLPIIQKCFEEHHFPRELVPELASLGLLGSPSRAMTAPGSTASATG